MAFRPSGAGSRRAAFFGHYSYQARSKKAIGVYEATHTLIGWLYEAVRFIDKEGRIKTPLIIHGDWEATLDLVDHIDAQELYPIEKKLRGKVDGAFVLRLDERVAKVALPKWMAEQLELPFIAPHLQVYCAAVFEILDKVLMASSAVECVNSVIRLRQGAKRHPHPDFVYLIAWLHNTRRFNEGRRKGLTPAELLGVQLPADGWSMLLDAIAEHKAACN